MNWLESPYPTIESIRLKLAISFGIGLVCAIFLLVFKPFGLDTVADRPAFFFGFGLMGTLALLCAYFIYPRLWPKYFDPEQWRIKHELLFFSAVILQISVMIYTYNSTIGRPFSPQHNYPSFLLMTIAVGVLPVFIMTYITEVVARGRNIETAAALNMSERSVEKSDNSFIVLSIKSEDKHPTIFEVELNSFLFAKAQNNYVQLYWLQEGHVENKLVRLKLKNLLDQIGHGQTMMRVHKSYVVYKPNILEVSGNARSLQITMKGSNIDIPVSRSFDKSKLV